VLSTPLTDNSITGQSVSFTRQNMHGPYRQFQVLGASDAFDWQSSNATGFPIYGSASSIDILGYSTRTARTSWARIKRTFQR